MSRVLLLILMSFILISCGQSYSVPRATLHIDLANANDMKMVRDNISYFLLSKEFSDLGIDEEMLKLLEWSNKQHEGEAIVQSNNDQINRIHRTRHFKHDQLDVDVMIIDYSDTSIKKRFVNYSAPESEITSSPSIELNIYNFRPGGFSTEAHSFYKEFILFLKSEYQEPIHIIFSPPETNQSEFYKISILNFVTSAFWWLVVFLVSM